MMDISQVSQYSHKIQKITIKNKNTNSSHEYVTIKVHLEKEQNEVIRFSYEENSKWIEHQSNENDYFLRIPNITPSTIYIYAHFLPADLYSYTEDQHIFSIYDFSDFFKDAPKEQFYGYRYPLQINSHGYEMLLGDDNKPLVRSLLDKSVTRYKDPNYKQYDTINQSINQLTNKSDKTEIGRFPLSSKYRHSRYGTAPEFEQGDLPHWEENEKILSYGVDPEISVTKRQIIDEEGNILGKGDTYTYKGNSTYNGPKYGQSGECSERELEIPYWEAKIHRTGLSPLIIDTQDENGDDMVFETENGIVKDFPINVQINYQYLPTSTEYHQHYYGFEAKNTKNEDGDSVHSQFLSNVYNPDSPEQTIDNINKLNEYCEKIKTGAYRQLTKNNSFGVLDGEELDLINKKFGKSNTYRLINHGDPFSDKYGISINHTNIKSIDLNEAKITKNCTWEKNQCSKYWTYIPKGKDSSVFLDVKLKAHTPYVLKYFIYIPADAHIEDSSELPNYNNMTEAEELAADSCYVTIKSNTTNNKNIIGQLNKEFRKQDKHLRHQWIYHEIPFYTEEADNRIVIKGPQHSIKDIYIYNNKTGEYKFVEEFSEDDKNSPDIELYDCRNDMIHFYSMQIAEMVEYSPTLKYSKTGMYITEEDQYAKKPLKDRANQSCNTFSNDDITEWVKSTEDIPIPLNDIFIFFDGDFEILYNELTSEIRYTAGHEDFKFKDYNRAFDTILAWEENSDKIRLQYEELLKATSEQYKQWNENSTFIVDAGGSQTDRTDDENPYKTHQGKWSLYRETTKTFTNGINNGFTIQLQDGYGNAITSGTVEAAIFEDYKDEKADCSAAKKCLGVREPDINGKIEYDKLNFKSFKPSGKYIEQVPRVDANGELVKDSDGNQLYDEEVRQHEYWLRIKYENPCYNKTIIQWKKLNFIQEHPNMIVYANTCTNDVCKSYYDSIINANNQDHKCCIYCSSSYYNIATDEYQNNLAYYGSDNPITLPGPQIYHVDHIDKLPLRLDVSIKTHPVSDNQDGNIIDEGYCELSINDTVVQSTYVDSNGVADFYLDADDLDKGEQIIKIEYFTKYNEAINYCYFKISCDGEYDERPAVPILLHAFNNGVLQSMTETNNTYTIKGVDDVLLVDIDTGENQPFTIQIEKENNDGEYVITDKLNVYNHTDDYILIENPDNDKINRYRITTGSLDFAEDGYYRKYVKEFIVKWIN